MPQDAFTLRLVARELDSALRGGKINRINQPGREELALIIYTGKRTLKLTLNANASDCGVYFTEDGRENPLVAPNFCMLLRKHLSGAEILGVETPGFERIVILRMKCFSDFSSCERELRAEIMGKYSNLILTENGIILGALKTTSLDGNCKRAVMPGAKYVLPAPQDKTDPSDRAALDRLLSEPFEGDIADFLFRRLSGIAPRTAGQIADSFRGGNLADHVYSFLFSDEVCACVPEKNGVPVDFSARAVEGARRFGTLSEAQSYYYAAKRTAAQFESEKRKLSGALSAVRKKTEKRLQQILEKQRECAPCEENRVKGELLTANIHALKRGMKSCELQNYYDGGTVKIALDETLSPAQNAQNYFKRYRKQKRALEFLAPQRAETESELDYLCGLFTAVQAAESFQDLKSVEEELLFAGILKAPKEKTKKKTEEIPFRRYEKQGFEILAGRNNLQNDRLVRSGAPGDVWLHVQKYHSCHVLIRADGKEVPPDVLLFAAAVCARYSDAKAGGKVPVDYCALRHVKKPSGSKAGFVVYTDYRTVLADPAEL